MTDARRMSDDARPVVHAITVLPDGSLVCRVCGATASSVIALSPIACLAVSVSTT